MGVGLASSIRNLVLVPVRKLFERWRRSVNHEREALRQCVASSGRGIREFAVGWDRGADRASYDADVSSIPPIIPYGGVSPVRLEGWPVRRDLPRSSFSLSHLRQCQYPTD